MFRSSRIQKSLWLFVSNRKFSKYRIYLDVMLLYAVQKVTLKKCVLFKLFYHTPVQVFTIKWTFISSALVVCVVVMWISSVIGN